MNTLIIEPDRSTIQGLILRGYTHPYSCHFLFQFSAGSDTTSFFKQLYPRVQNAEVWTVKPAQMLNIGLTYAGIQQLGVLPPEELATFPNEFAAGPWSYDSQQSLGDCTGTTNPNNPCAGATNPGNPSKWWGQNFANTALHCVVHAYALTQEDLTELTTFITGAATASQVQELFPRAGSTERLVQYQLPDDQIHFGYRDGISEPRLALSDGNPQSLRQQSDLANFLIGYCPQVSFIQPGPTKPSSGTVGVAAAKFAENGCYNAFRVLYQDVAAFNTLLEQQATVIAPTIGRTPEDTQEWLAAKIVGRWRNGSPLMLSPDEPQDATRNGEGFCYIEPTTTVKAGASVSASPIPDDVPSTLRCPFAAHTRVANPRDEHLTPAEGGFGPPRIMRRGMPYGPPLTGTVDDGVDRGLIGLFLCGSLAGQFEKIYGWMNTCNFASNFPYPDTPTFPQDALLGNRFTNTGAVNFNVDVPYPTLDKQVTVANLPDMIVTRGTAYCLLPSLATLLELAGGQP